jgi:hypothetical protein
LWVRARLHPGSKGYPPDKFFCVTNLLTSQINLSLAMSTKEVRSNSQSKPVQDECSVAAIAARIYERSLTFAEIAELSEKCGPWSLKKDATKAIDRPLTFVIPAVQLVASVSRFVE